MPAPLPEVYRFTDFREFLRERYEHEKRANVRFSHRYIADKVGASSAGWFSDVIKGRITLTGVYLVKVIKLFALKPKEGEYFEAMVQYGQAGSGEERNRHYEKLLAFKEPDVDLVGRDRFEYYSNWYHAAIRELLLFEPFRGDFAALARRLSPSIRPAQARRAVQLLERLALLSVDANGNYRATSDAVLKKDTGFKSLHVAAFLKAQMELGMEALERYPKEERDISALTLSLEPVELEDAREQVKALRKRLLALGGKPGGKKQVYQFNFQVFPLTRGEEALGTAPKESP